MGRAPDDDRDSDTETTGMYAVGMKRAICRMRRDALVRPRCGDPACEVPMGPAMVASGRCDMSVLMSCPSSRGVVELER